MNREDRQPDVWESSMALFDLLIESEDPGAVLAAEPDLRIREAATRLWEHHLSASKEKFLERTIEFPILQAFAPGQVLLNRFEIQSLLGRGGMGEVYLASDRTLGEAVALKTIARLLASSRSIRRRFIAEVQNARRITHPHVCRIHEIFDQGETVFFAMEYVAGRPLDEILRGGPPARAQGREVALQLAEGLDAAHRNGVVHGDFKPSNVLVVAGPPPRAVIMDFGLARALRADTSEAGGESLGAGTLDYMAPELLAGGAPTLASDIYAFGKVARQLLPSQKLWDVCTREHPGERPASLAFVIRTLRRDTTRRYWIGGAALISAAAPLYSFLHPAKPPLRIESGARILVNGFRAADTAAAGARLARSMLITALLQSPQIRAIADQDLLPALRRLAPGRSFPVEGDVLRGLLNLQRATHWIDGALKQANGRVSLSLRVWRTADQRLDAEAAFGDAPAVTALAGQTAVWVRRLAGESQRSLAANPADVTTYTSAVPEALQKYYEAMEYYSLGEMELAAPLLEEALRLDPAFAQAYNVLGMCWNSQGRYVEAMNASERATRLAVNLPERERAWIDAFYQALACDPDKTVEACRANMEYHPDEPRYCRIYGQSLCLMGRPAESIPFMQRAVELAPQNDLLRNELALALSEAGRFDEGLAVAEEVCARSRDPEVQRGRGLALLGLGRYQDAYAACEALPDDARPMQAAAKILPGELDSAIVALRQELAALGDAGIPALRHRAHEFLCGTYVLIDRPDLAIQHLRSLVPMPECPQIAAKLQATAFWAARIGDDAVLAAAGAQLQRIAERWENKYTRAVAVYARALQEWRRREMERTESDLVESLGSAFTIWALFDLADFFTATARPELAEEYWVKFEGRHGTVLRRWFPGVILYGWLNRGLAARMRGDGQVAQACASKVLQHWARRHPGIHLVQKAAELAAA